MTSAPLVIAPVVAPRVSVILVLYGRADLAMRAISALIAGTPACFELIIVDNASPDDSLAVVRDGVVGATIIANTLNVGFGAAVSVGALRARGEFLLLLNSDVFVEPGWLPPLLAALDCKAYLAGVSPMLLNLDGTAQEAGSMICASGGTLAIVDDTRWAYDFPRVVPYVSAACLLVRRSVFTQLGGFDTAYGRGYYEDVDWALELEQQGLLLAHIPGSFARHVRGASSNLESALRHASRNRDVFVDRWEQRLARLPHLGEGSVASQRRGRDELTADRILIIDDRVPHIDRGSGDPRMAQIATTLARDWPSARVTFLAENLDNCEQYAPHLLSQGVEVVPCPLRDAYGWLQDRFGHFSAVIISRPDNVVLAREMIERTQPQAVVVIDVEALYSHRTGLRAALLSASEPVAAAAARALRDAQRAAEHASWKWANVVLCVSEEEAAEVRAVVPQTRVAVVQLIAERPDVVVPCEHRQGALFFGGFMAGEDSPNADGVRHLVDELMPLIWESQPELTLTVAGWNPPPSVVQRASERVAVVGAIDHPARVISAHRVVLVPERFGAGIKTKLAEAMACGTPFVTSSVGAQGLHLGELSEFLVADEPHLFAALAAALCDDDLLWQRVHERLLALAQDHFSSAAFCVSLIDVMAELGVAPPVPV